MLLTFSVRLFAVSARGASARSIAGIDRDTSDTCRLRLVLAKPTQLDKRPVAHLPTHLPVEIGSFSDPCQIFQRKCLLRCFGVTNYLFRDAMIAVTNEPLLPFRRFFQATFGAFCSALLQAPPMFTQLLTKCFDRFARVAFTLACNCQFYYPEINPENAALGVCRHIFHVARRQKVEFAFDQTASHSRLVASAKALLDAARKQKGF